MSFDLPLPVDCDDDYWDSMQPDKAFKQPAGQPSRISAFICNLKLSKILGFALRSIVCWSLTSYIRYSDP